jgi:hypothetical protein
MNRKRLFDGCRFLGTACLLAIAPQSRGAEAISYPVNPAKVIGMEKCADCHAPMVEAWKGTHHHESDGMQRHPEAQDITHKLGLTRVKVAGGQCVKCHYTAKESDGEIKFDGGISCESCHGAAADWNPSHSNKDDKRAEQLGMIRPGNPYQLAANCFQCHTVPEEKLVNDGGHRLGSDFELVSWSQGEVRHNLQRNNKKNGEAPPERKRLLYVVGQALDLEYSLRALARATQEGKFATNLFQRVGAAKSKLKQIYQAVKLESIDQMLAVADDSLLRINNEAQLLKAAGGIAELTRKLLSEQDGTKLAALDAFIAGPAHYKGKVYQP